MGIRNECCFCPDAWEAFVGEWVFVYLAYDNQAFFGLPWQIDQVQDRYIVARRWTQDLGWQNVVIPCDKILALVDALPDPPPVPPVNNENNVIPANNQTPTVKNQITPVTNR